jgi:hypothetical protein
MIELPTESRLIAVRADGSPVEYARTGVRTWMAAAPSDVLPYELAITYDSALTQSDESGGMQLHAPRIAGLTADATLWTVRSDDQRTIVRFDGAGPDQNETGLRECSAAEAHIIRLEAAGQAMEEVQSARGLAIPPRVLAENFTRWHGQAISAGEMAGAEENARHFSDDLRQRRVAALNAAATARQRLIQAGAVSEGAFPPLSHDARQTLLPATLGSSFLVPDMSEGLMLTATSQPSESMPWRKLAAIALIFAAAAAPSVRPRVASNANRSDH